MAGTKINVLGGIVNAIITLLFFVAVPNLIVIATTQFLPSLQLGSFFTIGITSTGALLVLISFCRGAFPRHSVIWALAGLGGSLFSAAYIYLLISTRAMYSISLSGQSVTIAFDISLFGALVAIIIALNSISNLIELSDARRKKTAQDRLQATEIAA
jgi:hypothetical protein